MSAALDSPGHRTAGDAQRTFRRWRRSVFASTWLAYVGLYLVREPFSIAKVEIHRDPSLGVGREQLGWVDTVYSLIYALGQFVWGPLGDRWGPRRVVLVGMSLAIATAVLWGLSPQIALDLPGNTGVLGVFLALAVLQGMGQSSGWSPLVKNVGSWFSVRQRGRALGWWCTNFSIGAWVAGVLAGAVIGRTGRWTDAFFVPAALLAAIAVVFLLGQRNRPEDLGLAPPDAQDGHRAHQPQTTITSPADKPPPRDADVDDSASAASATTAAAAAPAGFADVDDTAALPVLADQAAGHTAAGHAAARGAANREAAEQAEPPSVAADGSWAVVAQVLTNRVVWVLAVSYFSLKFTRYTFFFWGALYVNEVLGSGVAEAAWISRMFALGGPLGIIAAGYVSDRLLGARRVPVAVVSMIMLMGVLMCVDWFAQSGWQGLATFFFLAGFFLYAADGIISGAAAIDFGTRQAAGTAAGLINGVGSLGSVLAGWLPARLSADGDWSSVFRLFLVALLSAVVLLLPLWRSRPHTSA